MESIISTVNELTSEFLTIPSEEQVFQHGIDKRNDFSQFVFENIESVCDLYLQEFIKKTSKRSGAITLLGGSRSWSNYFNKDDCNINKKVTDLSLIEKAAIIPGNYDLFCFCSDTSQNDNVIHQLCIYLDKIIKDLNESDIGNYFELHWVINSKNKKKTKMNTIDDLKYNFKIKELKKDCPTNTEPIEEGCIYPPCNALHLELKFSRHPNLPKKEKGIRKKNKNEYYNLEDFNEKVLFYFEIINIDEKSKNNLYKIINQKCDKDSSLFNYLNLEGLYLFSELIVQRGDKDYDVDLYRKKILDKVVKQNNIDIKNIYKNLLSIYTDIFSSRSDYSLKYNILLKKYIDVFDNNIISDYNSHIVERVRPFINSFIMETSLNLYNLQISNKTNSFIFLTGGDAYRRYLPDIQKTNDIDTKLIFQNKEDEPYLLDLILYNLSSLISILYANKNTMFQNLDIFVKYKDVNLEFQPVYKSGQFRLRLIKNPNFHLFSIDYRYKLNTRFSNKDSYEPSLNIEIPILDLVLYHSNDYESLKDSSVKIIGGLPIASEKYLANDLRNMYKDINENLKKRFPKSSKDKERFIKLVTFIKEHTVTGQRNKRKLYDELPNLNMLEFEIPYPKRVKRLKYDKHKTNIMKYQLIELYNYQTEPKKLENSIKTELYNNGVLILNEYIKKYEHLFLDTYIKYLQHKSEGKIQLQFNDISDVIPYSDIKNKEIYIEQTQKINKDIDDITQQLSLSLGLKN